MRSALSLSLLIMATVLGPAAAAPPGPEGAPAVACRALEVHSDARLGVTIVVFHHRDDRDRARVGGILRGHDGEAVEFRTTDGAPHQATLMRLKSCFGRGLLLFPADVAQLAEKDEFLLVEPTSTAPARLRPGAEGPECPVSPTVATGRR